MTNIFAKTTDQVLSATVLPKVACNNQNTVRLQVEFDAPWDGYTKTAVFYTSKNPLPYERALSSDGICLVPSEVLTEEAHLFITVKGVKTSGEIKSTTPLKMRILAGTPTVIISEPTDDVYRELLGDYDRTNNAVAVERARIDNLLKNSGSVEGDEVVDARVGFDGTTYPTAGDAVRKQTGLQSAMIHGGGITMTLAEVKIDGARVDSGGSKVVDSGWCHGYIDILSAKEVTIDTSTISDTTIINFANKNKEHVTNYKNWAPPAVYEVDIPDEARYLCISGKNVDADKVIITYSVEGLAVRTEQDIQDLKIKSVSPPPFLVGGESEINLSDVSLTYGIFRPTGDIVESATFLYGFIDISNAETFTVEMVEMTDTATVNFVDADKNFVSSALVWKGTGVYEISYMPDTAKYISVCCQKVDIDCISVKVKHKSVMKDVETNREDSTRHDAAYAHTRTNGAKFIKGLHLDCGRKYFSVANIKTLLDEMHEANLNTFQIYFSDNEGFRFGLDDMNVTVNGVAYDVSVALGDGSSPTDGSGKWLTQEEMDDIISYAEAYGIEVIPAFDMPGHFGAIRSKFNEPKFQETTEHGRTFMCELLKKYASYFASKGCRYFNICGDETSISTELYEKFMSRAIYEICKLNMTPLFYNDSVCKDGYYSPYLNNGGIVLGWIRRAGQAAYSDIDRCGYRMMNAKASPYYWVLNEDEKSADLVERIRNSDIFEMSDGSKMYNIVGAMYHIWCDIASLHGADEGDQIVRETADCIAAFGEAVNRAVPTDYWTADRARLMQTTGNSKTEVMSQKAVTDELTKRSNALKGTASGEAIAITDASPIEHEMTVKVSGVSDLGAVKVKKYGKNLYNYDSSLTQTGSTNPQKTLEILAGNTYTVSAILADDPQGVKGRLRLLYTADGESVSVNGAYVQQGESAEVSAHIPVGATDIRVLFQKNSQSGSLTWENIQVEVGDAATGYEPYIEPVEYSVSEDGTVDGVTSLYPATTLMTDTEGAVIDCSYNKDINKAFEELYNAIISLGGNI